jgi:sugar lactone lactonase YvrE
MSEAIPSTTEQTAIGEGLRWDEQRGELLRVDFAAGRVFRDRVADDGSLNPIGTPDGLTVDAEGDVWVAIWGGGRIHRYSPAGELRGVLAVPAVETTSCAFAGPGLHRLYVTTATEDWTDDERRADPKAGLVYRFDTDATGRPAEPFRPDPAWWSAVTEDR